MEQKVTVLWEIERDGEKYSFYMPSDAKLGTIYNVAFDILQKASELAQEAAQKAKSKEEESKEDEGK